MNNLNFFLIIGFILFVTLYNYALFAFAGRVLNRYRFSKSITYVLCITNAISIYLILPYIHTNYTFFFFTLALILSLEFIICFHNPLTGIITCSSALILHILCLRAIVTSTISLITNISLFDISHKDWYPEVTIFITLAIHLLAIILVIKLIPEIYLKIINQNKEFTFPFCLMSTVFLIYMIYNGGIYDSQTTSVSMEIPQIILPLVLLSGLYLGLWMMIRIVIFHDYKLKHQELSEIMLQERVYKNALFDRAAAVMEINCTKEKLITFIRNGEVESLGTIDNFTTFIETMVEKTVHPSDRSLVLEFILPSKLLTKYNNSLRRMICDYRALILDGQIQWYRSEITLSEADDGDIIAIATISCIQSEKELELDLRFRAEKDSLTGACNKIMTSSQVDSYLYNGGLGVLYMFDLDNFKGVNDTFGHSFGDEVLKEMCMNAIHIFREQDIIGRVGGDEFVVFMKDTISMDVIKNKAETMCKMLAKDYTAPNKQVVSVTPSIGIAIASMHGSTYQELFNAADIAMYHSKHSGKNTFTLYDPNLDIDTKQNPKKDRHNE